MVYIVEASAFSLFAMLCAIWYHLYILKNVRNIHGGVLLLAKCRLQPAPFLKVTLFHGCFSRFFKLYKQYQIVQSVLSVISFEIMCTNWERLYVQRSEQRTGEKRVY